MHIFNTILWSFKTIFWKNLKKLQKGFENFDFWDYFGKKEHKFKKKLTIHFYNIGPKSGYSNSHHICIGEIKSLTLQKQLLNSDLHMWGLKFKSDKYWRLNQIFNLKETLEWILCKKIPFQIGGFPIWKGIFYIISTLAIKCTFYG